jgi:hypothetical protein
MLENRLCMSPPMQPSGGLTWCCSKIKLLKREPRIYTEVQVRRPVVLLARTLAYIPIQEIIPGTVFVVDLLEAIREKYRFQQHPTKAEEMKIKDGIQFADGMSGKTALEKFVIWDNTLVLETRISTDESKELLESMLTWATEKFGFRYKTGDIKRFAYVNDVVFESSANLLLFDPVLKWLSDQTSTLLSEIWQEPVEYLPTSLKIGHDPVSRQAGIAPFSIERRGGARFSDNKYFSEAPLPTAIHLQLLDEFEKRVLSRPKTTA